VRYKASPFKAFLYVFLGHRSKKGLAEGAEELELADMRDTHTHQALNLPAVRLLEWSKTTNIKRLKDMRGM